MRVAIIGTGRMGTALGGRLAAAGHEVRVGSRDRERGGRKAVEIGARFGGSYAEAVAGAEAVVLAVPWSAAWETLVAVDDLDGTILIDVTNPFREGSATEQHQFPGSSGAEQLQAVAERARVVKAFNTIYSGVVRRSADFHGTAATVFVAGDDPAAKLAVSRLAADIGYEPVDAGPLSSARYLEPLAGLMTTLDRIGGGGVEHALKLLRRARVEVVAATAGSARGVTAATGREER